MESSRARVTHRAERVRYHLIQRTHGRRDDENPAISCCRTAHLAAASAFPVNESPALAVSPDAQTWQVVPIPIPAALADRGLTWADTEQAEGEPYDFDLEWGWEAYAHADTVFIALRMEGDIRARELWVGRVDTP